MKTVPFADLLKEAVNKEGVLSTCYSRFHQYSIGNQLWLWSQTEDRGEPLGPVATYKKWLELGRQVKKGSKAYAMLLPVTVPKKDKAGKKIEGKFSRFFMPRELWFTVHQTEGDEYKEENVIPEWNKQKALDTLLIKENAFESADGNCQGYASFHSFAVNPVAVLPHKTTFHELAHIVLGHTTEHIMADSELTSKDICEVEAESVAYILCSILGLNGLVESRGYIQHWLKDNQIDDKSAQKIFACANTILNAGKVA
jgi:antirestriction protein ArdC